MSTGKTIASTTLQLSPDTIAPQVPTSSTQPRSINLATGHHSGFSPSPTVVRLLRGGGRSAGPVSATLASVFDLAAENLLRACFAAVEDLLEGPGESLVSPCIAATPMLDLLRVVENLLGASKASTSVGAGRSPNAVEALLGTVGVSLGPAIVAPVPIFVLANDDLLRVGRSSAGVEGLLRGLGESSGAAFVASDARLTFALRVGAFVIGDVSLRWRAGESILS
jgi:hypothetical protein